ncbi:hypothetical protein JTE90_016209 [Oedothorax gibbosus]|uniref:Ig-like domain-containing protein n=1 Tax=Oedothorax gibbosus TaxID=931172 RepID=A0AAV6UMN2_9ARAC|nr:hypothetical protein JTE90_016209 [Oedothorax gibbosus]
MKVIAKNIQTDTSPATTRHRIIVRQYPDTAGWSEWMPWECPVTCGGGLGSRTRICYDPDLCRGPQEQTGECNPEPCPTSLEPQQQAVVTEIQNYLLATHQAFQLRTGDPVILPCKGSLTDYVNYYAPHAKVSWLRNGEALQPDNKRVTLMENQDLEIKQSSSKDNGIFLCILNLNPDTPITTSLSAVTVQNTKPDLVITVGNSLSLSCHGALLTKVYPNAVIRRWFHNSTFYKEFNDPNVDEISIDVSEYTHSGLWMCVVAESPGTYMREWPTNVVVVQVVPPSEVFKKLIEVKKKLMPLLMPLLPFVAAGVVVFFVFCCCCCVCCRRRRKKRRRNRFMDDDW